MLAITVLLSLMPLLAPAVITYLFMAPLFTLVPMLYDKEAAYCDKIQLLLYTTLAWVVATALLIVQYAFFVTVKDEMTGLWVASFMITTPTISLFARSIPPITTLGALFFVIQGKKYRQEIKSFYLLPYLYLMAETINIALSVLWISSVAAALTLSGYLLIALLIIIAVLVFYSIRAAHMNSTFVLKKITMFCAWFCIMFCIFYITTGTVGDTFFGAPLETKISVHTEMENALDMLIIRPDINLGRRLADLIAGGTISNTNVMSLQLTFSVLLWFQFIAIISKYKKKRRENDEKGCRAVTLPCRS